MIPISDSIKSKRFPFINILIIAATVFVFFQQITTPNPDAFIRAYALIPALVDFANTNTLFPFVTSMFLHGGFLHIISNLLFLWVFGDNVEGHLGYFFFPFLYLASGIAGGLAQYVFTPNSIVPMLGASGAIAGVLGSYFVLFPLSKIKTIVPFFGFVSVIQIPASFMLGYWFLLQIISGAVSVPLLADSTGGIAFFAHIGGFVTGYVLTRALRPILKI